MRRETVNSGAPLQQESVSGRSKRDHPRGAMPVFITVEGGEGSGKTTLFRRLAQALAADGVDLVTCREPGGTPLGERLRALLLDPETGAMTPLAEAYLYAAARAEVVATVIRPALERGQTVLCDRFLDSSVAYQGHGLGLGAAAVEALNRPAVGDLRPDLTLLVDIPPGDGLRRAAADRPSDRIEGRPLDYHARVREGFLTAARRDPERVVRVLDGRRPPDAVFQEALDAIRALQAAKGVGRG